MLLKDLLNNFVESIKIHFIKYVFIYAPIIGSITYTFISKFVNIEISDEFIPNLINVSGVLAGFLFTALGILISLPRNKFIKYLLETGHMKIIYNSMILGVVTLLISMILGLFNILIKVVIYMFIIGISETLVSAYYLYRVSYYSSKSS